MVGKKWAVLIGVDVYEQVVAGRKAKYDTHGRLIEYETLHGAVSDILRVKQYLTDHMGVLESRIRTLMTRSWDDESNDRHSQHPPSCGTPTYSEIIEALAWVLGNAEKGDLVYFHYSGHGAQATTVFPTLKGEKGLDEALVPTDANIGGKYLRDIEMALWLKKMVNKGLIVTVVLDSCHSGSATRGSGRVRARGIQQIYGSAAEDLPSLEFMAELNAHGIGTAADVAHQGSIVKEHWLLEPQQYTLMAACLPRETALEYEDEDGNYHGAFTYWLLDTLRKNPQAAASTRNLHRRAFARIQSLFSNQTPVIGGTTDRAFFGTDILPTVHHILVQRVDSEPLAEGDELDLAGGALHNVRKGSVYGIFSFTDHEMGEMLARVEVEEVFPQRSVATFTELIEVEKIEPGCRAVLLSVPAEQQFRVCLSSRIDTTVVDRFQKAWEKVPLRQRVWMQLVPEHNTHRVTFRIEVDDSGDFEIQDGNGVPLPNLVPPLPKLSPEKNNSLEKLVNRLRHLTLFNMVKQLQNLDETSTMRRAFQFELVGKSRDKTVNTSPSNIANLEERNGAWEAKHNDKLFLRVKNQWDREVFFAIFDIQPLFGVTQIYPVGGDSEPLDTDSERLLPLDMTMPKKFPGPSCVETFKIFVTPRQTSLGVLELPNLYDSEAKGLRGGSNGLLQSVLDGLMSPYRDGRVPVVEEWGTDEITIRTSR